MCRWAASCEQLRVGAQCGCAQARNRCGDWTCRRGCRGRRSGHTAPPRGRCGNTATRSSRTRRSCRVTPPGATTRIAAAVSCTARAEARASRRIATPMPAPETARVRAVRHRTTPGGRSRKLRGACRRNPCVATGGGECRCPRSRAACQLARVATAFSACAWTRWAPSHAVQILVSCKRYSGRANGPTW